MSRPIVIIHNVETNEIVEREMNDKELAIWEADKEAAATQDEVKAEAEAKRQALLDKLGITEEEARLLLGGN